MEEIFVKKHWEEEDIWFYLHFQNGEAVRQLQISFNGKIFLTKEHAQTVGSMLYDQLFSDLDLKPGDHIAEAEFNEAWNGK